MAHIRPWSDTQANPSGGSNRSDLDTNIQKNTVDVEERVALEHHWDNSAADGNSGKDSDGLHIPGGASVVLQDEDAADIVAQASGSVMLAAYNGSVARARDTGVLYVKVGTDQSTTGTWTAVIAQTTFVTSNLGGAAIFDTEVGAANTWQDLDIATALSLTVTNPMLCFLEIVIQRASKTVWLKPKGLGTSDPTDHWQPGSENGGGGVGAVESNQSGTDWYGYTTMLTSATGVIQIACSDSSDNDITIKVLSYIL